MKDNWVICKIDNIVLDYIDFRGKTPLKLGMNWGGGNIRALSANNVEMGKVNFEKECYFGSDELYQKWMTKGDTEKGDVLLTMEAPLGNVAQVPDNSKYILSQRTLLFKFDSTKVDKTFMFYQLSGKDFQRQLFLNSTGSTVTGIQQKKLIKIKVSYPESLQKQQKIAKILSTCDEVIEKTEAAIAKYKAIKQGMMQDLFTRGIDVSTGKLRPSYQEAPELYKESELGMIPKKWEVKRLEDVVDNSTVITYGIVQTGEHIEGGVRVLRTVNLKENGIDSSNLLRTTKTISDSYQRTLVKENDIVCNVRASVGDFNIITKDLTDCNLTRGVARISVKEGINPFFILWFLRTKTNNKQISLLIKGTTFIDINIADLRKIYVFVPINNVEQDQVADKMQAINLKLQAEESSLSKYKKLKEGLMQDLLTGKVEVSE